MIRWAKNGSLISRVMAHQLRSFPLNDLKPSLSLGGTQNITFHTNVIFYCYSILLLLHYPSYSYLWQLHAEYWMPSVVYDIERHLFAICRKLSPTVVNSSYWISSGVPMTTMEPFSPTVRLIGFASQTFTPLGQSLHTWNAFNFDGCVRLWLAWQFQSVFLLK